MFKPWKDMVDYEHRDISLEILRIMNGERDIQIIMSEYFFSWYGVSISS